MVGFVKCPRSSWASKLDVDPLSFICELSYTYSSSASLAWQSLLLALISIDGHLHSPLIRLVDARLSSFSYWSLPPHSIPPIVLYPWLTLIYWVKLKMLKRVISTIQLPGLTPRCSWFILYAGKTECVILTTIKCIEVVYFSSIIMKGNHKLHACLVLFFRWQMIDYCFEPLVS